MKLTEADRQEIITIVTKNGKGIRASRPKYFDDKPNTGRAAYVWRNAVFYVSKNPAHQCIPAMAEFYLCDADYKVGLKELHEFMKELDTIVDEIINKIPKTEWHGLRRWSSIL